MPIIVPCIEERIQFEEETGIVQEAEIVQGEDSFNLPATSQPTPIIEDKHRILKKEREELIDAALMKIGEETDPEDHLFEFCSKSIKKYPAEAKNEALESIANYVFQMNKKYLQ
ncbi:hypothetical protein TNCT_653391 [Trichonephila clavata]|uniref:Uncharacterized protein n=1 Tax=Trichonephila clavata TaxID=2740835 RepID=A0A8X6GGV6_TRICU|nr:hypothetical protein TNCT_653391 [Trichonephila clavata]